MTNTVFANEVKGDKEVVISDQIEELTESKDKPQYDQLIGYLAACYELHLFTKEETQSFEIQANRAMGYEEKWSLSTHSIFLEWQEAHQPKLVVGGVTIE